jgi:hypothetical protein
VAETAALSVCCCIAPLWRIFQECVAGREHPSHCGLGRCLQRYLSDHFPGMAAASVVGGMSFLSVQQF